MERNGQLEVEIIQARGLILKPGSKGPPGESSSNGNFCILGDESKRKNLICNQRG